MEIVRAEEQPRMWIAGIVAGLLGLALIVAVALLEPDVDTSPRVEPLAGDGILPTPGTFRTRRFAHALRGYDPRQVEAHIAELTAAYERLYLAAGPTVLARASRAAAPHPGPDDETPPTADAEGGA